MTYYKKLIKVIEDYTEKTHLSIQQKKERLKNWTVEQKKTLLKYGVPNYDEKEYDNILKNGNDEEIWEYERQIIDNLTKGRQDNIVKYLTDFNEKDYQQDNMKDFDDKTGEMEHKQGLFQDKEGYSEQVLIAHNNYTGQGFTAICNYSEVGYNHTKEEEPYSVYYYKEATKTLCEYLDNSKGLQEDTILFRGGDFPLLNLKVGNIGEIPCLSSTTYDEAFGKKCAEDYQAFFDDPIVWDNDMKKELNNYRETGVASDKLMDYTGGALPFNVKIYAPKGTEALLTDTPQRSNGTRNAFEHEAILNRNQKFIITDIDPKTLTATVKLI